MQSAAKLGTTVTVVIPPIDQGTGQPERRPG
jgi:hypothetical protein